MTITRIDTLQQLVDGMLTFVAIFSREGRLLEANRLALSAGGLNPEAVYGTYIGDLEALAHTPESRRQVIELFESAAAGRSVQADLWVRLAGERLALVDAHFMPLFDERGEVARVGASGAEITAHHETQAALHRLRRQLRMLSSCNQLLMRAPTEADLLHQVCRVIVQEGGYRFAWVGFADADAPYAVRPAASAGIDRSYLNSLQVTWADTPMGRGPTGCAIRSQSVQVCRDIGTDPAFSPWREQALALGYACSVALPIVLRGACIGALNIYSSEALDFDPAEVALLNQLAEDIAYGLGAMRSATQVEQAASQVQLFRRLLDSTDDMIYVATADSGRIIDANGATCRQLGYTRDELLRMSVPDFSLSARSMPWRERLQYVASVGSVVFEGEFLRKSGSQMAVEVSLSYVDQEETRYLISVARDITRQRHQQSLIEHMARVRRMQNAINAAVLRIRDRNELLTEACRVATQVGGYDRAVVSIVDADGRCARPAFRAGAGVDFPEPAVLEIGDGTEPDTSLTSRALRTGAIVICNDLMRSDPPVAMRERLLALGFKTVVGLPLIVEGRRIGCLTLSSRDPTIVGDDELLLLEDMSASLAFALRSQAQSTAYELLASYDPLTGLANRSLFCRRLDDMLAHATVPEMQPAVAVVDINQLSSINDTYGRRLGDLLLQKVAERLRRAGFDEQRMGYVGGGRFVLVEPKLSTSEENVNSLLEATVFKDVFSIEGRDIRASCRSGVARAPRDGRDGDTLLQHAEAALKQAKDVGEQYLHYRLEMHSEIAGRLALESRLRIAVDEQQFTLYYQPQVSLATGRIEAVEALLRWNDPAGGVVPPADFLPVLEASGLIVAVGDWVLVRAVGDCLRWAEQGLGPLRVAVNVSALQLRRRTLVTRVLEVASSLRDRPGYGLDLEITETALLQDVEGAGQKLRELRAAGIRVALDDFGTGYSSMGLLSQLPVDVLKIDRSFVAGLPAHLPSVTLAGTIVSLATAFGLQVVAEGVETAEQLALLRALQCTYVQGYLHYPPMPAAELERLMRRRQTAEPGAHPRAE